MILDTIWGNLFLNNQLQDIISIIKEIPLFKEFSYFELVKISRCLHSRKYHQNETVFQEKEPGAGMYIIKSGSVKIFLRSKSEKIKELAKLEKGCFFGEIALIDEAPRSASAITLEDSELLGFFKADLMTLIDRDPRLASKILLGLGFVLGQRLRKADLELKNLKQED